MTHNYYIPLNKPILLFFPYNKGHTGPISNDSEGNVIMVTIKGAFGNNVATELTTFYLSQCEITKAVENLVFAHILAPLPPTVIVRGKGYVITGTRKVWKYGKTLRLGWGESAVQTGLEKWIFVFEIVSESELTVVDHSDPS